MQLDQNPFFRKPITPWYDANPVCWLMVLFSVLVAMFSFQGAVVAFKNSSFSKHLWFPCFLGGLSLFLALKVVLRLNKRKKSA